MQKHLVALIAAVASWGGLMAQTDHTLNGTAQAEDFTTAGAVVPTYTATEVSSEESARTDWLSSFTAVSVDGPMKVRFVKIAKTEGPRIAYDTKGFYTSRFRAAIDKNGVLRITERTDPKRRSVTEVTVYYHTLERLTVARAEVSFDAPLDTPVLDMDFSSGAQAALELDVRDLKLDVTGKCSLTLSGRARYLSLTVSSAKIDATALQVMSAAVGASKNAQVQLCVSERLEAEAASAAAISYRGDPEIVRGRTSAFGGHIMAVQ